MKTYEFELNKKFHLCKHHFLTLVANLTASSELPLVACKSFNLELQDLTFS